MATLCKPIKKPKINNRYHTRIRAPTTLANVWRFVNIQFAITRFYFSHKIKMGLNKFKTLKGS